MVQQTVAGMTAWKSIVQSALPCMMILFYGAWSDRLIFEFKLLRSMRDL